MRRGTDTRQQEIIVVEAILRDYPAICLSLERRRRELEASVGPCPAGAVMGGKMEPEQQRILDAKLRDVEYCELSAIVERLGSALIEATEEIRFILRKLFFDGDSVDCVASELGYARSVIFSQKRRAVVYMRYACMDVLKMVWRWRDRETERAKRALKYVV